MSQEKQQRHERERERETAVALTHPTQITSARRNGRSNYSKARDCRCRRTTTITAVPLPASCPLYHHYVVAAQRQQWWRRWIYMAFVKKRQLGDWPSFWKRPFDDMVNQQRAVVNRNRECMELLQIIEKDRIVLYCKMQSGWRWLQERGLIVSTVCTIRSDQQFILYHSCTSFHGLFRCSFLCLLIFCIW